MSPATISSAVFQGDRSHQEDRLVVIPGVPIGRGVLLAVMDGHNGSATAEYCEKRIPELFRQISFRKSPVKALERMAVALAKETRSHDSGSTLSLVYVYPSSRFAVVAWIGDSPVAIVRGNGTLWTAKLHNVRSNDESRKEIRPPGFVSGGYVMNPITEYGTQCSRCIGDDRMDEIILRVPDVARVPLGSGSRIMVASDGVFLTHDYPVGLLDYIKFARTAEDIMSWVKSRMGENGHPEHKDNCTIILWCAGK